MKRILLLLAVTFVALSCEGPQGPPGEGATWRIQEFTVQSRDWEYVANPDPEIPGYFEYVFEYNAITEFVYTSRNVMGYHVANAGTNYELQSPLPFIEHKYDGGNAIPYWTETYSFDYQPESVAFQVKYSDFAMNEPPTKTFRVIIQY